MHVDRVNIEAMPVVSTIIGIRDGMVGIIFISGAIEGILPADDDHKKEQVKVDDEREEHVENESKVNYQYVPCISRVVWLRTSIKHRSFSSSVSWQTFSLILSVYVYLHA